MVYVPDDFFERKLRTLGIDDGPMDNYVKKSKILEVTELVFDQVRSNIYNDYGDTYRFKDFTGLEAFTNLKKLHIWNDNFLFRHN